MPERLSVLLVAAGLLLGGCVDSRCYRNADCPAGRYCEESTGSCEVPQCTLDSQCPAGSTCQGYQCLTGCRTDLDCQESERCVSGQCMAWDPECNCTKAPAACGEDRNPKSATFQNDVCLADFAGKAVVLVFGSVACPHCHSLYKGVLDVQSQLDDASSSDVVFINLESVDATAELITYWMDYATEPILQDTKALNLWGLFGADWYHIVLINPDGCLQLHWGPLSGSDLDGEKGQELLTEWNKAVEAECAPPLVTDIVEEDTIELTDIVEQTDESTVPDGEGPDVQIMLDVEPETVEDVDTWIDLSDATWTDLPGDLEEDSADTADLTDTDPELTDAIEELTQDTTVEPFQLAEVCQIEAGEALAEGELIPHFLCMDRNSTSQTFQAGVSEITLNEQVWIAYFGACT